MEALAPLLERISASARQLAAQGEVADYLPALRCVERERFGLAVATLEGDVYETGDSRAPFSIQSISKVFSLVLACKLAGDALWERVGRLPSSSGFSSLVELEIARGKPRNPFVNPGALAIADLLYGRHTQMERAVVQLIRE